MGRAAEAAGVVIAGGDTKVVEHGKADRMYITSAGMARLIPGLNNFSRHCSRPATKFSLSGPIGDHGITILFARGELDLEADIAPTRAPCCLCRGPCRSGRLRNPLDA